ncbi:hypothetical protein, partial [Pediococcus acidilactici]|uniref:hypothetical protein n=1 Tax=Pediococcus acidilactici TaxID=1254 RepID=UPI001F462A43
RRVSGATDALFLFSIIPKAGLEKSEDFSRPALFLETYVTASSMLILNFVWANRASLKLLISIYLLG